MAILNKGIREKLIVSFKFRMILRNGNSNQHHGMETFWALPHHYDRIIIIIIVLLLVWEPLQLSRYSTGVRAGRSRDGDSISDRSKSFFPCSKETRPALVPTQSPNQLVQEALLADVKRQGRKTDQSPPSTS
jgi:hypothetical protein